MNIYTIIAIWLFSINFRVTQEDGVINFELVSYKHNGIASNGNACESIGLGTWGDKCDPYFKISLTQKSSNSLIVYWQSSPYDNLEDLHYFGSVIGQLPNPLKYNFKGGLSELTIGVKIEIFDADPMLSDDHIATLQKWIVVPIATNARDVHENQRTLFEVKSEHVRMSYRVWVSCDKHFYHDCSQQCKPMDSVEEGHFNCDKVSGARLCMSGWRFPPTCLTVDLCQPTPPQVAPCLNNGNCTHLPDNRGFTCACAPGFNGKFCEKVNRPCHTSLCMNGGTCLYRDVATVAPDCECAHGWTGNRCQYDLNECTSVADLCGTFNATCENVRGSFYCHCPMERSGSRCQFPAVDRVPSFFRENALASDSLPSYYRWLVPVGLVSLALVLIICLFVVYCKSFHKKMMLRFFSHNLQASGTKVHFCAARLDTSCNDMSCKFTRSPAYALPRAPSLTESLYEEVDDKFPVSPSSSVKKFVSSQNTTGAFGNIIYGTHEMLNEHNPLYSTNSTTDEEHKNCIHIIHATQSTDI